MMSLETMRQLGAEAAARALREGKLPKVFGTYMAEHRGMLMESLRSMPNIGTYRPVGWEVVPREELAVPKGMSPDRLRWLACDDDYVFVDASGMGAPDEPALTFSELGDLVSANPLLGWAIVETGQFQVVIGAFRHLEGVKAPKRPPVMDLEGVWRAFAEGRPARCHNAHTDGQEYTLHASVIAFKNREGGLTLDWCGWYTRTTAKHMRGILHAMGLSASVVKTPGQADRDGDTKMDVPLQ